MPKPKQPRLLPPHAPIREEEALSFSDPSTRYRCRCGNRVELGIQAKSVVCVRCGSKMKATEAVRL